MRVFIDRHFFVDQFLRKNLGSRSRSKSRERKGRKVDWSRRNRRRNATIHAWLASIEIKVRENKIDWNRRNLGCFVERRARYTSGWNFFIETLHPLLGRAARCLRPNISDSLRKHICLRTNTAKARGEGEAEPSWRCLEAKWNAECVWDCLHCRTIFRVF